MKIAKITDQHFGARNDNQAILDNQERFYDEIFFPKLIKEDIKVVFDLGDTFDKRKGIDFRTFDRVKKFYFDRLRELGITLYSIIGNHTTYYRDVNHVNTLELILKEYKNVVIYSDLPEEISLGGKTFLFAPWINSTNIESSMKKIKESRADILCAHLEIEGFQMQRGNVCKHGMNRSSFAHFDRVWTGHFHSPSIQDNIHYLGSPTETTWSDYGDEKGFYIYDTETDYLEFIENDIGLHQIIQYDDTVDSVPDIDLKGRIVRVNVVKREDMKRFNKFMSSIFSKAPFDVKVEERFLTLVQADPTDGTQLVSEAESIGTEEIVVRSLKGVSHARKGDLEKFMLEVYQEALNS